MDSNGLINDLQREIDELRQDNCVEILKEHMHIGEGIKNLISFTDYYNYIVFFNDDVLHTSFFANNDKENKISLCTEHMTLENIIAATNDDVVLHIIKDFLNQCLQIAIKQKEVEEQLKNGMEVIHDFSIDSEYE